MAADHPRLRITEIFFSLQGEAAAAGFPTVFVRLTGCPLRCGYCDTAYAFSGGQWLGLDDILARVRGLALSHVCVTGGEPLAQKNCLPLLQALCDAGYDVSLETSGAVSWAGVDPRVTKVVDVKTPASGEVARNLWDGFASLRAPDQVKFVICSREDYEWAVQTLPRLGLAPGVTVLFSPAQGLLAAQDLADWILADRLPVRFQVQLHKFLWGDAPGK
ncbi:MAG: hypothetical protein RL026_2213 [Pseudomonadota bacterium]|jgi:7-carboxy-7-deazaguanine synthase